MVAAAIETADVFSSPFATDIFRQKYAIYPGETWSQCARRLVENVCRDLPYQIQEEAYALIRDRKFIPAGRYLYYAGRDRHFFSNCYAKRADDTREGWADLWQSVGSMLMTGGGVGVDYSDIRPNGDPISRTGGVASGPISLMDSINEIGRNVMQGGSRRSALWAGLNWNHKDVMEFIRIKDWDYQEREKKASNFNHRLPMELTNISVIYGPDFFEAYHATAHPLHEHAKKVWELNCRKAFKTAEPGFSFNQDPLNSLRNAPVSADTWVLTLDGYLPVRDLIDEGVTVWTGKRWAPTTFKRTKTDVQTVVVSMTGGREIKADPTHEFKVERYKGPHRKVVDRIDSIPAGELQPGDILHVSLPEESPTDFCTDAYTLGFLYGDGTFSKAHPGRAEVTLCTNEKRACHHLLSGACYVNETDSRGYMRLYWEGKFEFEGLTKTQIDFGGHDLPSAIAGYFDADGSYDSKQRRVRLSSKHKTALEDMRRYLEQLGIMSHINKGANSGYTGEPTWMLVVAASSISRFARVIPTHRLQIEGFTPYRQSKIKVLSVTQGPIEDVYCCDVGVEEHTFCAEGVIISNCTEFTTETDSDRCNLGTLWINRFNSVKEWRRAVEVATAFLLNGAKVADYPSDRIAAVGQTNNRIGLGIGGFWEWLMVRGEGYEVTPVLAEYLHAYQTQSDEAARGWANYLGVNEPKAKRAIAPNGTIGIIAESTTGIEPLFCAAYKRRYLKEQKWHYQYVIDTAAQRLIQSGVPISLIEGNDAYSLDFEQRVKFQADVQKYVDMAISSTCNLHAWETEGNLKADVKRKSDILLRYAPNLRGFTCYPDGARGGQPITKVSYGEANIKSGRIYEEGVQECVGGVCGA